MPVPFAAAAVPLGAKILGMAKGLVGGAKVAGAFGKGLTGLGGMVRGGNAALQGLTKGQAARGAISRFAGDALAKAKGLGGRGGAQQLSLNLGDGVKTAYNMSDDAGLIDRVRRGAGSIAGFKKNLGEPLSGDAIKAMVMPDLLFGGMAALSTEGDIVDKAIAGTGAAAGGIVGGLGARGILGPKSQLGIIGSEIAGGMAGDMVGYGLADNIIRAKHGGMTPAEQGMSQQDEQYRAQLMEELKQQYGL